MGVDRATPARDLMATGSQRRVCGAVAYVFGELVRIGIVDIRLAAAVRSRWVAGRWRCVPYRQSLILVTG